LRFLQPALKLPGFTGQRFTFSLERVVTRRIFVFKSSPGLPGRFLPSTFSDARIRLSCGSRPRKKVEGESSSPLNGEASAIAQIAAFSRPMVNLCPVERGSFQVLSATSKLAPSGFPPRLRVRRESGRYCRQHPTRKCDVALLASFRLHRGLAPWSDVWRPVGEVCESHDSLRLRRACRGGATFAQSGAGQPNIAPPRQAGRWRRATWQTGQVWLKNRPRPRQARSWAME
jgi:hypothetical protein